MQFQNVQVDWPLNENIIRRGMTNHTFGMVRKDSDGTPRPHQGWDLYAKEGTDCYSISDGQVVYSGQRGALGLLIVIRIGFTGYYAAYAHMKNSIVAKGGIVKLGDKIGQTGKTGNAVNMSGEDEHLHFEIRNQPITGLGLEGRISPIEVFGKCPRNTPAYRGE